MIMKTIVYLKIQYILFGLFLLVGLLPLQSCKDGDGTIKSVDLRYKVEDSYLLEASNPQKIEFLVKSSDPWIVYGKADWHSISPDHGEAGETFTVCISCEENTALDDRRDTVVIKSDYWVGKEFVVTQKGIAYLTLEGHENFTLGKGDEQGSFNILANQNWSAKVTDGAEWLSIVKGDKGSQNGEVTLAAIANKGEARTGVVTIYDRHNIEVAVVSCTQDGLALNPESLLYKVMYDVEVLTIPVESNAEWTVSKANDDDEWFSLAQTEFTGSSDLIINMEPNKGSSTRTTQIIFSTKAVEGVQPVVKTLTLKQAYLPKPVVREFEKADLGGRWTSTGGTISFDGDAHIAGGRIAQGDFAPGYYSFYIKEMSADAYPVIYFTYDDKEIRWHIDASNGTTDISTRPWTPTEGSNVKIDITQPHVLSLDLSDADGYMQVDWLLDGKSLLKSVANIPNNFMIPFGSSSYTLIGCDNGSCVFDKYEYTEPIDWGE